MGSNNKTLSIFSIYINSNGMDGKELPLFTTIGCVAVSGMVGYLIGQALNK
jgi:hypothetical protein